MGKRGKKILGDIFAEWKKQRFIIADEELVGSYRSPTEDLFFNSNKNFKYLVIMTDVEFWSTHADECISWCHQYNCNIQGMTIEIPTDEMLTLFTLKWS